MQKQKKDKFKWGGDGALDPPLKVQGSKRIRYNCISKSGLEYKKHSSGADGNFCMHKEKNTGYFKLSTNYFHQICGKIFQSYSLTKGFRPTPLSS